MGKLLMSALLEVQADWKSLLLADVRLVGGSGGAAPVSVASSGELSLLRGGGLVLPYESCTDHIHDLRISFHSEPFELKRNRH
eukprot:COSAG06_NODE_6755_length_2796_cov_24.075302_2_plen_83_part_00